jgi:hypothetical protein
MNIPDLVTDAELEALVERNVMPPSVTRFKLLRDVPDVDLVAGAIGRIVDVWNRDDREFVMIFDCRPGLRVTFRDAEFDSRSPEYMLEVLP